MDELNAKANYDNRDIIMAGECRGAISEGFITLNKEIRAKIYFADFTEYSKWLKHGSNKKTQES